MTKQAMIDAIRAQGGKANKNMSKDAIEERYNALTTDTDVTDTDTADTTTDTDTDVTTDDVTTDDVTADTDTDTADDTDVTDTDTDNNTVWDIERIMNTPYNVAFGWAVKHKIIDQYGYYITCDYNKETRTREIGATVHSIKASLSDLHKMMLFAYSCGVIGIRNINLDSATKGHTPDSGMSSGGIFIAYATVRLTVASKVEYHDVLLGVLPITKDGKNTVYPTKWYYRPQQASASAIARSEGKSVKDPTNGKLVLAKTDVYGNVVYRASDFKDVINYSYKRAIDTVCERTYRDAHISGIYKTAIIDSLIWD